MRRCVLFIASLVAVFAAPLGGQVADTGTIVGHVRLTSSIKGRALPSTAYPTRAVGAHDPAALPEIKNVVVYLKDVAFRGPCAPDGRRSARNTRPSSRTCSRSRRLGGRLSNDDPFFHNVFSLSSAATFDLRRYPRGQSRAQTFPKAGIVKVYCNIHSHMSATILVMDNPYFTIPALDGGFELKNVPPGEYTLVGWHERVGERRSLVRVERGKATTVDLSLPVEDPQ